MLDRRRAGRADVLPSAAAPSRRPARQRALVACAALVLAVHVALIGGVGRIAPRSAAAGIAVPLSVRTVISDAASARGDEPTTAEPQAIPAATPALEVSADVPAPRAVPVLTALAGAARTTRAREGDAKRIAEPVRAIGEAGADFSDGLGASPAEAERPSSPPPAAPTAIALGTPAAPSSAGAVSPSTSPGAAAPSPTLLSEGEQPPPLYRTQLPASATLHYQVRRGLLRGTGEIRWQADAESYSLALEARFAGVPLLRQTSQGAIGLHGLAPVRFLDQRARRAPQAANFRGDDERITFSGSGVEWPLLGGSQDRLSWMMQLAGIAAADPQRLQEGERITMVVVGARGDAAVWTLRCAGRETVETASGPVPALKLVREARSAYDTSAEIWLDPQRAYLPARATLRNSGGASEYELLLERVDPG